MCVTSDTCVQQSCSELLHTGTFLGTSHINVEHSGLDECVEAVKGFLVVNTEDEVGLEEFIESCQGCLSLARDGLMVNNDIESLEVALLFTDTQEDGLSWFQTLKEDLNTGANLEKNRTMRNHFNGPRHY